MFLISNLAYGYIKRNYYSRVDLKRLYFDIDRINTCVPLLIIYENVFLTSKSKNMNKIMNLRTKAGPNMTKRKNKHSEAHWR